MTIGVWGDSISYGSCDSDALGWVGRLRKSLLNDDEIAVYNFGVCGDTTENILKRFHTEAEAIKPERIIFAVGINDSKYQGDSDVSLVPLEAYKANLLELISQAKKFADQITIIGATPVDNTWKSARGSRIINSVIEKYNEIMIDVAHESSLQYISMFECINIESDLSDGLHPNAQGYQKMFEVIKANL